MNGYVLHGVDGEILLVMRGFDEEEILHIIGRIRASRRKDIKELADELEKSLYDNGSRGNPSQTRPKNKGKGTNSPRSGRSKAADTKHRTKSCP
jgi:hypothetical protein